jgi:hypothetical protein
MFPNHPQRVLKGEQPELDEDQVTGEEGASEEEVAGQSLEDSGQEDFRAQMETLRKEMEQREAEYQKNITRLQSSLDRQIHSARQEAAQASQEWENRYHQEKMATLDEKGQLEYQNQVLMQRMQDYEDQLDQFQKEAMNAKNKSQYLSTFLELGIDPQNLNMGGTVEDLVTSGWQAIQQERVQMREQLKELQEKRGQETHQKVEPQEQDVQPKRVATNVHGPSQPGPRSMKNAIDDAENILGWRPNSNQLFELVNRGQLDPSILPGLEGGVPSE